MRRMVFEMGKKKVFRALQLYVGALDKAAPHAVELYQALKEYNARPPKNQADVIARVINRHTPWTPAERLEGAKVIAYERRNLSVLVLIREGDYWRQFGGSPSIRRTPGELLAVYGEKFEVLA